MPGFYGCLPRTERGASLAREFASVWPDTVPLEIGGALAGVHAHAGHTAALPWPDGARLLVDGDVRLYALAARAARAAATADGAADRGALMPPPCAGNLAWIESAERGCTLASDWAGAFPLYIAERDGALLFSSLLRPLARALGADPDPVGIAEFLLHDYTLAGRSLCEGIRRLLPGQRVRFERDAGRVTIEETSRAWVGTEPVTGGQPALSDRVWDQLVRIMRETREADGPAALMMSAGWDSRLLFAALLESGPVDGWCAYSHGDLRSRELRTVERMCRARGVRLTREALVAEAFETPTLQAVMQRAEGILFPHWGRAGSLLAERGSGSIVSGVYGEVLGGHYSPAGLVAGPRRALEVGRSFVSRTPRTTGATEAGVARIRQVVAPRHARTPRFLDRAFLESRGAPRPRMDADLESDLTRLVDRGIGTEDQLVEAFLSEHRGTQYIIAQPLTARPWMDVSLPFADRDLLALASRIPLAAKVQNACHRAILAQRARDLLRYPTAAVWVPASAPILLQEFSRLGRWTAEKVRWRVSAASRGRIAPDTSGWWNFEFLRSGELFGAMREDLRADFWDRDAVDRWVTDVASFADRRPVYPDILLRVYAVDLALR